MNTQLHTAGKKLNAGDRFILRNEYNGLTVYDRAEHLFYFYEGIFAEDAEEEISLAGAEAVRRLMAENERQLTKNVRSDSPFSVCWMISGSCNLDCIYCFAENKMTGPRAGGSGAAGERAVLCDEAETAKRLLELNALSVALTGGEPTLNPRLKDILLLFKGKVGTILDTNGTTAQLHELIPTLRETNTAVRLTVDILDDEILNTVRPRYRGEPFPQCDILKKNISALTEAGVPLVIHTVLTRYNIGKLEDTAEELIRLGVRRWHFYPVNISEKCRPFYEDIKVSRQEACDYTDTLAERFGRDLKITCPRNDIGARERAVLLVDSRGRFLVDTVHNGSLFLGKDPARPEKAEIMAGLDFELHKQGYLCNFW